MNNKICRLCLSHPAVCFSLLEPGVSDMLAMLTEIKVNTDEDLPTISCTRCLVNLKLAFSIQQNFLRTDEKLRQSTLVEVKPEFVDVDQASLEVKTEIDEQDVAQIGASSPNQFLSLGCSTCLVCGVDVNDFLMVSHFQEHFKDKQTCDSCNISFDNLDLYKTHLLGKQCKLTVYNCSQCGATFRYKSFYNTHIKQAHLDCVDQANGLLKRKRLKAQGPFTCEVCQRQFQTKRQFYSHSHEKRKCPICDAEITKSNLAQHIKNHSSGPQICEICGTSLRSWQSLRSHLSQAHTKSAHKCEECDKTFTNSYRYLLHKKQHAGDKSHVCESCGKAFLTWYKMNKHIEAVHLSRRPYVCQHCDRTFVTSFTLKCHMWKHTNETPYKCGECGAGFRHKSSLNSHVKSKHNIFEPETFPCSICDKKFSTAQGVIAHMRVH